MTFFVHVVQSFDAISLPVRPRKTRLFAPIASASGMYAVSPDDESRLAIEGVAELLTLLENTQGLPSSSFEQTAPRSGSRTKTVSYMVITCLLGLDVSSAEHWA